MDRIEKLCSYLSPCKTFADVGCDHGYCTLYALKNGLCESAVVSDISEKCLDKARVLLDKFVRAGAVTAKCCFGMEEIEPDTEQVLIAGMGGDEITDILKNSFIPHKFVLQPMKNPRAVREYLLKNGAAIERDEIFESGGKFYFVIKGCRAGKGLTYSEAQLEYCHDTKSVAAQKFLKQELNKKYEYLARPLGDAVRAEIEGQARLIRGVLK